MVTLSVNGKTHRLDVAPDTPLLYVLRDDLGLHGPKFGCGVAQCGSCTVLIDGKPARSCVVAASKVGPGKVVTLEGLGTPQKPHAVQQAFIEEQARPVRVLHQRHGHAGHRLPQCPVDQSLRPRDTTGPAAQPLPLWDAPAHHRRRHACRGPDGKGGLTWRRWRRPAANS